MKYFKSLTATFSEFLFCFTIIAFSISGCSTGIPADRNTDISNNQHRPLFHFTPDSMWMNDPNGMVYFEGEYHLFYQYYPDSTVWGPMHWGHAVSKDLVKWEHLPIALYPDSLGYIFSGSAVVDVNNTSGFGEPGKPAMVAIYTYHNMEGEKAGRNDYQTQGIAFSNDKGRTWTKYDKNPVLKNPGQRDFRDPKVLWHQETAKWIMTLAAGDQVCFYSSPDLKSWTLESEFGKNTGAQGGVWECPDLFEMPVVNSKGEKKWVLLVSINPGGPNGGSATQYFIGSFDGHTFTNESTEIQWVDQGKDNYAGVTFSDIPSSDGRIISIGWMSNWQYAQAVPTVKWRSAMTFPRQHTLVKKNNAYVLTSTPVDEIQLLREQKTDLQPLVIKELTEPVPGFNPTSGPYELSLEFELPSDKAAESFGVQLSNSKGEMVKIGYNKGNNTFFIDRQNAGKIDFSPDFKGLHTAPYISGDQKIEMQLLIDVASVELFAMKGEVTMTDIFFPNEDFNYIRFFSDNGEVNLTKGFVYKLTPVTGMQ
jgi:fructan beta-fructosidase